MEIKPLVTIKCMVYNHEPYLRQCLDGFVMQKTNFSFEAIVHDDASTDDSANIIREYAKKYPDIIIPIYETENQYSKGGFELIIKIMNDYIRGKYIAICEGDDYWTDPYKLQKQVDYLESHSECGLIYTQVMQLDQQTQTMSVGQARQTNFENILICDNPIPTPTACFRKIIYDTFKRDIIQNPHWKMADFPLWLYISYYSKIKFFSQVTGVYRILGESASHSSDINKNIDFILSSYSIKKYFAKNFNQNKYDRILITHTINDLFKSSFLYDKNINRTVFKFAMSQHYLSFHLILKLIIFSSSIGRKLIIRKYSSKIL